MDVVCIQETKLQPKYKTPELRKFSADRRDRTVQGEARGGSERGKREGEARGGSERGKREGEVRGGSESGKREGEARGASERGK